MNPSIFYTDRVETISKELKKIGVDKYGIKIMAPKASMRLIRFSGMPNISANILKQEMLSLGADAAVSRNSLTGKDKKTDCLLMGNILQFERLIEKLKRQPFGLSKVGSDIKEVIENYSKENFTIDLGRFKLTLGRRTLIMGVLNLTPDSFSGDGVYANPRIKESARVGLAVERAKELIKEGADIIDIGGESSRPGARAVSLKDEAKRVIPVIKALAKRIKVPISVDTYKSELAKQALDNGAVIVNDITALRDRKMASVVSRYNASIVLMHMKGSSRTMQKAPEYESLIDDILNYLSAAIKKAVISGVKKENIIIDPGIGFGKTLEHNLEILRRLREFKSLGAPVLVGTSRKSFIGKILNLPVGERLIGTAATVSLAITNGANIVRVHDVGQIRQVVRITDSILRG